MYVVGSINSIMTKPRLRISLDLVSAVMYLFWAKDSPILAIPG
jgi:hypothetical protein